MTDHLLRFEIWWSRASRSYEMSRVTHGNDCLRQAVSPDAVLVHAFDAASDFDAFQKNNDWHGYGVWTAPAGLADEKFTESDVNDQCAYLARRSS